jgi:hypothetical protein
VGAREGETRRAFLGAALSGALLSALSALGCGARPAPKEPPRPPATPPPITVGALTDLLPLAGLRWLVLAKPRAIASVPWLIPAIGRVVPERRLDVFAAATAIDLRQAPEAAIASYEGGHGAAEGDEPGAGGAGGATMYLVRHAGDGAAIERAFRGRLTSGEHRVVERPDLVRVSGATGKNEHALVVVGRDVVGIQEGGDLRRGSARVAAAYALGKLKRSPTALSRDPLRALDERFGGAPARAFALGPFEGELARGARGLLAGATALGASARPSAREKIALALAVAGDFTATGPKASEELLRAWSELADGSFGHLLGLDRPVDRPLATHSASAVAVSVEIDPDKLASGLAAATGERVEEMMR